MLARPEKFKCVECGRAMGTPGFAYYHGLIEKGPAYWSDRGILCSIECSLAHHQKRLAEGTLPTRPAPDPFDGDQDSDV